MLLDYACSWLVVPPSSPALGSWGKDPDCHKGLGGVFCVSGPRGLSTEGSWVSWSTSWSIFFWRNWHLSHSWFDPSCTVVPSHSSALLGILFPLFSSPPLQGARFHPRRPGTSRPELRARPKPGATRHERASGSSQNAVRRQPPSHRTERHRQDAPFRAATQDLLHGPRQTGAGCQYRHDAPQGVTGGYMGLQGLQEVTGIYRGFKGVTRGFRGF